MVSDGTPSRVCGGTATPKRRASVQKAALRPHPALHWTFKHSTVFVFWCVLLFCSTTLFVVADVFQEDAPQFPLIPTVFLAVLSAIATACVGIVFGKWLYLDDSFQVYQPFAGGSKFVVMQATGYFLLVTAQVVVCGYVLLSNYYGRHGIIAIGGAATLVSNTMLLASSFVFEPSFGKRGSGGGCSFQHSLLADISARVSESPNRETLLVTIFTVAQIGLCGLSEWRPAVGGVGAFVVGMFHILSGVTIHFIIGSQYTPRYRLFMPFPGTLLQACAQGCAWLVYFATLYGSGFLCFVGYAAPPLSHVALACGCLVSTVGLILFTRLANFNVDATSTHSYLSSFGCAVLTATCALQTSVILLLTAVLMLHEDIDDSLKRGLGFCQSLTSFFVLLIPPCTHFLGHISVGDGYRLFQPFKGGMDFIMLQSTGWACFGLALLFETLQLTADDYKWIFLEAVFTLISQVLIHSSLRTFRGDVDEEISICERVPEGIRNTVTVLLNGELITAFLFMACALALRIVVDVSAVQWDGAPFPREAMLLLATLLYGCATPIAHLAGRHHHIPVFRPFNGSGMYVALQSIGWTIYAAFLLTILFSWVANMSFRDTNFNPMFISTFFGVAQFIPLVLIAISVAVEAVHLCASERHRESVTAAFGAILRAEQSLQDSASHADQAQTAELLKVIEQLHAASVGLHGALAVSPSPLSPLNGQLQPSPVEMESPHSAATLIVVLMSLASFLTYVVGSFWTGAQPIFGVAFATAALAIVTTSCVALHSGYGAMLHSASGRYVFFMPFVGGTPFVALQSLGWSSYTTCAVLTIACAIERRSNPVALILAAFASVVAQFSILMSIPKFDPTPRPRNFLQTNSAGLVATFTFLLSFVFAHLYGQFRLQTFGADLDDSVDALGHRDDQRLIAKAHMVPLVISAVSMTFAIPLTFVALRSRMRHRVSGSETSDTSTKDVPFGRRLIRDMFLAVDSVVFALSLSIPAAIVYSTYYLFHNFVPGFVTIADTWGTAMLALGTLLALSHVPSAISGDVALPEWFRKCREAFITFQLYLIPTHASLLSYSMPLIFPGSLAAIYFAVAMSLLTLAAHVKLVRKAVLWFSYVLLGYVAYHHCHDCWTSGRAPALPIALGTDVLLLWFWVKYEALFRNKPHETGSLRSQAFVRFMERYVIPDVESYFKIKLMVDPHVPSAKGHQGLMSSPVSLSNVDNQYIFSYHPHGVFPGTALFLPFTKQWRYRLGWNAIKCVTVHAAGIIFNVPMVRDFLLRMGGRVVTRGALDASLNAGNSVMIVTGGQAEMLHTKYSDTEMHLVTHHLGFLKLSVRHQVPVVPIVCFAEHNVMDNIHTPWLQKKMLGLIGFPFPTVPHGRWYLPLPNRTPLCVVAGNAVHPPQGLEADDIPGMEAFAAEYFEAVKRLFYKYRAQCGYPDMELVLHGKESPAIKK